MLCLFDFRCQEIDICYTRLILIHLPKLSQLPGFRGFHDCWFPPVPEVSLVAEMSAWVETLSMMVFLAVPILHMWFTKVSRGPVTPASCNSIDQISWSFPISSKSFGGSTCTKCATVCQKRCQSATQICSRSHRQCDPDCDFLGMASSPTLHPRLGTKFDHLKEKAKKPLLSFEFVELSWMITF